MYILKACWKIWGLESQGNAERDCYLFIYLFIYIFKELLMSWTDGQAAAWQGLRGQIKSKWQVRVTSYTF